MTIKIWDNIAGWVSQKSLKIYNGTAWATAKKGWIYGVKPGDPAPLWHQFYPEYPVNTASPSISGNTAAGSVLSCSTGTWTSTDAYVPTSYSYQWKKGGVDISNQVLSTYTTVSGDVGSAITCSVTATNERGNTTVASSNSITVTSSSYTVTWNANGGSVSPPSSTVNAGSAINPTPTPTRANYTFNGWYNATSGGSLITTGGASYTPTSSTTLYAQWTLIQYTVTWNPNGGSVSPTSSTVNAGSSVTAPTPTRSGYTFNEWRDVSFGDPTVTVAAGGSYTPSYNITFYARWTASSGTAPSTPTNLFNQYSGGPTWTGSWTASTGTTPITYYWTLYQSASSGGSITATASGNTTGTSFSQSMNSANGLWAYFTVYASNSAGNSGTATSSWA